MSGTLRVRLALLMGAAVALTACSNLLPRSRETSQSQWGSFAEAKDAYDRITPTQATLADLRELGFDPERTANVRILSYLDVQQRFLANPSMRIDDLDPNVRACLAAFSACQGLDVQPKAIDRERVGNVALDIFDFRRETVETGWSFAALILLKDSVVVYKTWGGSPNIHNYESQTKPLGPLQDMGEFAGQRARDAL